MTALPSFSSLAGRRLHLGVCGSVAAYKAVEVMRGLQKAGVDVSVCLTPAACRFITPLTFAALGADPVYTAMFGQGEAPFAHLEPGRVADAFLVVPATAATLARLAHGMADDMLAAQCLAFAGPLLLAPAMNPRMWQNPATQANMRTLTQRGAVCVTPASGHVACGDEGQGRLADTRSILYAAARALCAQDMAGKKLMLTLGPTWEPWDSVRVWTNRSTGRMGAALATAAFLRGAEVHAVAGPGVPELPFGVHRLDVTSAREMFQAAADLWPQADIGVFSAAVADFSPAPHAGGKFKKKGRGEFSVRFTSNDDILGTLAAGAGAGQRILGFAAETDDLERQAREKLRSKKADMIAANLVGLADSGFAAGDNRVFVCDAKGREEHWPLLSKGDVAWRLLDWLLTL